MAIPDFQALMVPVLRQLADGVEHSSKEIRDNLAVELGLTEDELAEMIPSGRLPTWNSRIHWANQYLYQSRAIERTRRGVFTITARGRQLLAQHPDRLGVKELDQFQEFRDFKARSRTTDATPTTPAVPTSIDDTVMVEQPTETPYDRVAAAAHEANTAVAAELLLRINEQPPAFLEKVVLDLLVAMGYAGAMGKQQHLGKSGDEGIDGAIYQDRLGLERIYVQAKRYASGRVVGRPDIQGFIGALQGAQSSRGVFITTSRFSNEARTFLNFVPQRVILLDGDEMTQLMVEHGVGVQTFDTVTLRKIDEDFFD